MKKIIANKVYDTVKARRLGEAVVGGASTSDFDYCKEALYQKRTGEYFLHGEGGPHTKYAVSQGQSSWSGGDRIIPLTYDTAREWAEEHLSADEYEEIFGLPAEDDSLTALNCQIDGSVMARVRQAASQKGSTLAVWVEYALRKALE